MVPEDAVVTSKHSSVEVSELAGVVGVTGVVTGEAPVSGGGRREGGRGGRRRCRRPRRSGRRRPRPGRPVRCRPSGSRSVRSRRRSRFPSGEPPVELPVTVAPSVLPPPTMIEELVGVVVVPDGRRRHVEALVGGGVRACGVVGVTGVVAGEAPVSGGRRREGGRGGRRGVVQPGCEAHGGPDLVGL